jgi:hypothetical protein
VPILIPPKPVEERLSDLERHVAEIEREDN